MAIRFFIKPIVILTSLSLACVAIFAPTPVSAGANPTIAEFRNFVSFLENGQAGVVRGLYVENIMSLPVIQQPLGDDSFVSSSPGYATEFRMAANNQTTGILAHNYLAGQNFFTLVPGQEIKIVYGDAKTETFVVTHIQKYQALSPNSPSSDFVNLDTEERFTASSLFSKIYGSEPGDLILQTCITANQNQSWGRLFVIAKPINKVYGQ